MTISLHGETVVISGGARRLGRAIALACAGAGASVAITYNTSAAEAAATVEDLKRAGSQNAADGAARFSAFKADVSRADDVAALAAQVQGEFGGVTALVNNAAVFRRTPFSELTEADFDAHIGANLKGPFLMAKAFGDIFVAQKRGAIVNMADIHGIRPLKNYVPYCVSKAGVIMLTQVLAKALAPDVRVNCVCPGTILVPSESQNDDEYEDSEELLRNRVPLGRLGTPEEIAEAVVFLIGGPSFISGAVLPVDGAELLR